MDDFSKLCIDSYEVITLKRKKQIYTGIISSLAMILLILDAKTALEGAKDGIVLCLYTVVPSLFPFFVLSQLISGAFTGSTFKLLTPLRKLCGIPAGTEPLLFLGLIGGYPVGAQGIYQAYSSGHITKLDAHRMLGFCSNAGPAFIFGMVASLFSTQTAAWALWIIHILSALLVGCILPHKSCSSCILTQPKQMSVTHTLESSVKIMANVSGWVILFRIILSVCNRWFLWALPQEAQICFTGLMELTNGCHELRTVFKEGERFILSSAFLGFGGICVALQTLSVTKEMGTGLYFPGKILHCAISAVLASAIQWFLFPANSQCSISPIMTIALLSGCLLLIICMYHRKKVLAFQY